MARTHKHLIPYQFKKGGAPKKAIETPQSKKAPAMLPPHSFRRQAAIEMLTAGKVGTR